MDKFIHKMRERAAENHHDIDELLIICKKIRKRSEKELKKTGNILDDRYIKLLKLQRCMIRYILPHINIIK